MGVPLRSLVSGKCSARSEGEEKEKDRGNAVWAWVAGYVYEGQLVLVGFCVVTASQVDAQGRAMWVWA